MDVYRKGAKSVHVGWQRPGVTKAAQIDECNLDSGGLWGPDVPAGIRCVACFGPESQPAVVSETRRPRPSRPGRKAAAASGAAALALILALWTNQPMTPAVATLSPGPSSLGATLGPTFVSATPGASSEAPPEPSESPPATAAPVLLPDPNDSGGIVGNATRVVIRLILPKPPGPLPKPCRHPGQHFGVDACRWPGNR